MNVPVHRMRKRLSPGSEVKPSCGGLVVEPQFTPRFWVFLVEQPCGAGTHLEPEVIQQELRGVARLHATSGEAAAAGRLVVDIATNAMAPARDHRGSSNSSTQEKNVSA